MSTTRSRRVRIATGTAFSGCAVSVAALLGSAVWARDAGQPAATDAPSRIELAQGSMMSTPRPAAPAPAPSAPRAGSSMMNTPRPAAPAAPVQPVAPPVVAAPATPPTPSPAPATPPATAAVPPAIVPAPSPVAAAPPAPTLGTYAVTKTATGYSASNLRVGVGRAEILIPRADISGSPLGLDEMTALLDPAATTPLGERLQTLSADEVAIPSLAYRDREEVVSITGVSLRRLASGVVGALDIAGATNGPVSLAHAAATDLDLGLFARLAAPVPATGNANAGGKLYATLSLEGLSGSATEPGSTFRIARVAGRDVAIAQTAHGWSADIAAIAKGGPDTASPELRRLSHAAIADLYDALSIGGLEMTGLETSTVSSGGKGRIGRLAMTANGAGGGGEVRMEDFDAGSPDGHVHVATVAVGGISLQSAFAAFRDWSGATSPDDKASLADMRRFVPTIGSFQMAGLGFDTAAGPAGSGPVHVDVSSIEARSGRPVNGQPTDMQFAVHNVTVPVPADSGDDAMKQLASLGYAKVSASFGSNVAWNPATQEIAIRDLSLQAGEMGSVTIRGLVGNVSPDLFNPDSAIASVAAIGVTARALDITIHNDGLAERLLAREAKAQNRKPEDIRRDLAVGAAVMVPTMIGETPAARVLSQALGRFVAKPGTLTVQLKAKQPTGYGFTDYAAAPSPIAALDQFEVTAKAE